MIMGVRMYLIDVGDVKEHLSEEKTCKAELTKRIHNFSICILQIFGLFK